MERLPISILNNAINTYKHTIAVIEKHGNTEDYPLALDKVTVAFLEELEDYRQKEEQGLLLRLPVPLGTDVYSIDYDIDPKEGIQDADDPEIVWLVDVLYYIATVPFELWMMDELGKTIFLTKKEAEKALEEMKVNKRL